MPPDRLLKALLVMARCCIRSERQLCEQIDLNLLFHRFLDLQPSGEAFDATTFTTNRGRWNDHELTRQFFDAVVAEALTKGLCREYVSGDGTRIESLASVKSFRPKSEDDQPGDANSFKSLKPEADFPGEKRTNETHQSRTDSEARLYRKSKGQESKLSHMGHGLSENRHGQILGITATEASGTAERKAALEMLAELKTTHQKQPKTLGADKGYADGQFFRNLEALDIQPHIPLVIESRHPMDVPYKKQIPDIRARRRMKRCMTTRAGLVRDAKKRRRSVLAG